MFAKSIIDSDLFLDMPHTTQNLYFHLAMRADDDGFINNPKSIMRNVRCNDDDLRLLITKQFIIPFDSGIIVIKHWKIHNYIRKDRYTPTKNQEEMRQISVQEDGRYFIGIPTVDQMSTNGIPNDNQTVTKRLTGGCHRLGEDRLGKDRLEGERDSSPHPQKQELKTYGKYNNVLLTDEQHADLVKTYGQQKLSQYIKKVDIYCQKHGKSYDDYDATIRSWIDEDKEKEPEHSYDLDEFENFTLNHVPQIKGSNNR